MASSAESDRLAAAIKDASVSEGLDPMVFIVEKISLALLSGDGDFLPEDQYVLVEVLRESQKTKILLLGSRDTERGANILAGRIIGERDENKSNISGFYILDRNKLIKGTMDYGKGMIAPTHNEYLHGFRWVNSSGRR
jgi:hypothetical protein